MSPGKNASCILCDLEKVPPKKQNQQYFKTKFIFTINTDGLFIIKIIYHDVIMQNEKKYILCK